MAKKEKTVKQKTEETEHELYYVVNIYDNHGTINITQSGNPEEPPPTPPGGGN
jgi:hypothetical protein